MFRAYFEIFAVFVSVACRQLAKFCACIAKCMTTINKINIFSRYSDKDVYYGFQVFSHAN